MLYWSFRSHNINQHFIRHRNFQGELTTRDGSGDDFAFTLVDGLAGAGVSFRSVNFPDLYLRHRNFRVMLEGPTVEAQTFRQDATFHPVPGLADDHGISFLSHNVRDHYLRHRDFHLWVEESTTPNLKPDATFHQEPACFQPNGPIGDRWHGMGGEVSSLGCAISPSEYDVTDQFGVLLGRRRDFQGGQIAWSPNQGPKMVVTAYEKDHVAVFEWGPTDPFNYDFFIVRWSMTGGLPIPPNAQEDVPQNAPGRTRTTGFFHVPLPNNVTSSSDGHTVGVSFIVEGCDGGIGSSNCRQGWTCPIECRL
jgi:hypothetical protein